MQQVKAQNFSVLHIFAFCTVPLACWQKWIFTSIPNYYLQHAFIYIAALFMLWAWRTKLWTAVDAWHLLKKAAPWAVALFLLQMIAMWQSALAYPVAGQSTIVSVFISLAKLAAQLPFILFFALLCKVLVSDAKARKCLLSGAVAAFIFIALICAIQALWLFARGASLPWLAELAHKACAVNIFLAPLIEAQWKDAVYDFYSEGSYTIKLLRMNGVFEEASALAAWIGTFFIPVSLGITTVRSRWKIAGWGMAALCFVILFISTSFAGVVLGLVGLGALAAYFFIQRRAFTLGGCFFIIFAAVAVISFFTPEVRERIHKIQTTPPPRIIVTMATFELIKKNPAFGVGRGWFTAQITEEPIYEKGFSRDEEIRSWKKMGLVPHLSALPAAMAEYGIPVIFCMSLWLWGIVKRLLQGLRENPQSDLYRYGSTACLFWIRVMTSREA